MFCNVILETAEEEIIFLVSDKSFSSLPLVQEIISLEPITFTSTRNPNLVF